MNEKKMFVRAEKQEDPTESNNGQAMTVERLSENVSGVVHNVKSLLVLWLF